MEGFFEGTPLDQVQDALRLQNEAADQITLAYGVIFADTGSNKVLVDTGLGNLSEDPGLLNRALLEHGVRPEEVDAIVNTHAHGDHTGGLLDDQERLVYPNARIYTWKREWDFWLADPLAEQIWGQETVARTCRLHKAIEPALSFVEPGAEILPGIHVLDAHGHTPGHLAVQFSSQGEILLCISDMVFHPLQLEHPTWLPEPIFMIEPQAYIESKQRLLDLAADKNVIVHGMHFAPFPSLGRVVKKGDAWQWQPV